MDLLTHAALGASLGAATTRPGRRRWPALAGAVAGMIPDVDVLVRNAADPLLAVEFHRTATHALLTVAPIGALGAGLVWLLARRRVPLGGLLLAGMVGTFSHDLLDACTSFGIQLLWPFTDWRFAGGWVAVIDPAVTLTLLLGLWWARRRGVSWPVRLAPLLCLAYIAVGAHQQSRVRALVDARAAEAGWRVERVSVKPTLGNLVLWRAVIRTDDRLRAVAVRLLPLRTPRWTAGQEAPRFRLDPALRGTRLARDVGRFERLADGFLMRHPEHPEVVGDARYALLADRMSPLWGVEMDVGRPERPLPFRTFRKPAKGDLGRFARMVLGRK